MLFFGFSVLANYSIHFQRQLLLQSSIQCCGLSGVGQNPLRVTRYPQQRLQFGCLKFKLTKKEEILEHSVCTRVSVID